MEEIVKQALLYDFYGELLTEHQKQIYEEYALNDYSLSEIAKERGISRQGVHDIMKRCNKILDDYESRLHLVEKFLYIKGKVNDINQLTQETESKGMTDIMRNIKQISNEILEEL